LHLAQCSQASTILIILLATSKPSSRVQWRRALHYCIQHFALHLVHLVAELLLFPVTSTLL
ncbi:unnamed protein product, partial [Staurois parvus]